MRDRDQQQRTDERPQNNSSIADHMTLLLHFDNRSRMFDLVDALSRNSNTAATTRVNKRLVRFSLRSGTGVPPVNHAQDARATIAPAQYGCLPAFDDLLILLRIGFALRFTPE